MARNDVSRGYNASLRGGETCAPSEASLKVSGRENMAICDYEGSKYRIEFWQGQGREYEDAVERVALRALLPPRGRRIVEIGAGFGRLADLYQGDETVVLLDYAKSQLQQARAALKDDPRFIYVVANLYHMPLADGAVDVAVTVRVLHHVRDLSGAFAEIARVVRPRGTYVLEYANKRHLKAILRWLVGRQRANPFTLEPYEFVPLNLDFAPADVERRLRDAGFTVNARRAVSIFRLPLLKRLLGYRLLAALDGWLQKPLAPFHLAPSMFLRTTLNKPGSPTLAESLWRCLRCNHPALEERRDGVRCPACGAMWPIEDGIYNFKVGGT